MKKRAWGAAVAVMSATLLANGVAAAGAPAVVWPEIQRCKLSDEFGWLYGQGRIEFRRYGASE